MRYTLLILSLALGGQTIAQTWPHRDTVLRVSTVQYFIIVDVLRGVSLSKVEIWAVPSDAASNEYMLGTASSSPPGTWQWSQPQTWELQIPSKPLSFTHVFAKAFDMNGKLVATKYLPQHGETELHNALWKKR